MKDILHSTHDSGNHGSTLVDIVRDRARTRPDVTVLTFLGDGINASDSLTYARLDAEALRISRTLRRKVEPGARALLLYSPGLDFVTAFFGCLYAGVVAIPTALPKRNAKGDRLQAIVDDAQPEVILTAGSLVGSLAAGDWGAAVGRVEHVVVTDKASGDEVCAPAVLPAAEWEPHATDLAFLQYTSGSTASPKGVMVTHANILENCRYIQESFRLCDAQTRSVSWLPGYHDMGLIDGILQPIHTGFAGYLMPPTVFFQQPVLWLQAISRYRATHSGGPNFAFELCRTGIAPEQRQALDLSGWESCYNGAEPVRAATLDSFAQAFSSQGFRKEFFYPCYGMAETTLMVTGGTVDDVPCERVVDAEQLKRGIVVAADAMADGVRLVSSGRVRRDTRVAIVDPATRRLCDHNTVGEIWVAGSSVAAGYWNRPELTQRVFGATIADGQGNGAFLRTGDMGFMADGELYVTGRLKDMLIIRGRNYYPQDIEAVAECSHTALRPSANAAFSVDDGAGEQLVLVQELQRVSMRRLDAAAVSKAMRAAIGAAQGIRPDVIVFVGPGQVPKTTSGKIQRRACRQAYMSGTLTVVAEDVESSSDVNVPTPTAIDRRDWARGSRAERAQRLSSFVGEIAGSLLGVPPLEVDLRLSAAALGLDSMGQLRLCHRLENAFGVRLPMAELLDAATLQAWVDDIGARVDDSLQLGEVSPKVQVVDPHDLRLSAGQGALVFLHRLRPLDASYNVSLAVEIGSHVDCEALRRAMMAVADRHAALRSRIDFRDDGAESVALRQDGAVDFDIVNVAGWTAQDVTTALQHAADAPFDLSRGVLRCRLYSQAADLHHLLVVVHHLAVDMRSMNTLFGDLFHAYAQERLGMSVVWQRSALQAAPFADWQVDFLRQEEGARQLNYWRERLAAPRPPVVLPVDRADVMTVAPLLSGAIERRALDGRLSAKVRAFARQRGVTSYVVMLAAFQTLLQRYGTDCGAIIGSSMDARPAAFESAVGYFANQVSIRSAARPDIAFDALVTHVDESVRGAFRNREFPFAELVRTLSPERADARSPYFDVMFGYLSLAGSEFGGLATQVPGHAVTVAGLNLRSRSLPRQSAQFDLMLTAIEADCSMSVAWEYVPNRLDSASIERMHGHFIELLAHALERPGDTLGDLPILPASEHCQIVNDWNKTEAARLPDLLAHELVEDAAARYPAAVAVSDGVSPLTYEALISRATAVACWLRSKDIGGGAVVGIHMPLSIDWVVAMLGVLKAGAAYVPLESGQPVHRIGAMASSAGLSAVLVSEGTSPALTGLQAPIIPIRTAMDAVDNQQGLDSPTQAIQTPASADALAYVLYTSGSTGEPKGVEVTHRGLVNYLVWARSAYANGQQPCDAPVNTSIAFDATVTSLFVPLISGGTVHLLPKATEMASLARALERDAPFGLVKITPAQLQVLASHLGQGQRRVSTHCFVIGGEALQPALVKQWRNLAPGVKLINEYGPTETVVGCCVHEATASDENAHSVPIGKPIANTRLYVLDARHRPVPIGVTGELFIGGAGVARGYRARPDLTGERFFDDPFAAAGERMYRSGDLARWDSTGRLHYLGRNDEQVKIRGHRMELGEIEASIRRLPAVRECAVAVRDISGNARLVAHVVVGKPMSTAAVDALADDLLAFLPPVMVPSEWITHASLPVTQNGKIDRSALARIQPKRQERPLRKGRGLRPLQRQIMEIWSEALGSRSIGLDENFFDAGGHSLLAATVHQRMRSSVNSRLSLIDIYEHPTVRALERHVNQLEETSDAADLEFSGEAE